MRLDPALVKLRDRFLRYCNMQVPVSIRQTIKRNQLKIAVIIYYPS